MSRATCESDAPEWAFSCGFPSLACSILSLTSSSIAMAPTQAGRAAIFRLMNATQHGACPCHGHRSTHAGSSPLNQLRNLATPIEVPQKEYAFEVRLCDYALG